MHAVVALSTFRSQNVQSTPFSEHFWKLRCRKSARRCGTKQISKSKVEKTKGYGALLDVVFRGKRRGLCTLSKVCKTWGFCSSFKTMARVGHLKRIGKDAFRVAGAVQETHQLDVLGDQGGDFLRKVSFWSMRSSGWLR